MMDNQTSTAPTKQEPCASGEWRLLRLYPSTWLVLLLTAGLMFLIEFPGHETYSPFYQHGWPLVWLDEVGEYNHMPPPVFGQRDVGLKGAGAIRFLRQAGDWEGNPWSVPRGVGSSIIAAGLALDLLF